MPMMVASASVEKSGDLPAAFTEFLEEVGSKQQGVADLGPMLGYPMNNKGLEALASVHAITGRAFTANNCGDPLGDTNKPWKTHSLEQEGRLLKMLMTPWGADETTAWGYITTGGTEGVTKGIQTGYERLQARGYKNILAMYGAASHYSVGKGVHSYCTAAQKAVIPVDASNAIRLDKLRELLTSAKMLGVDAVLMNACLGTTFFGGMDDLHGITAIFTECGFKPGESAYMHVDAALHGGFWCDHKTVPKYTLGVDFSSISVSGHKWWGGFVAGSVLITKFGDVDTTGKIVEYVGMADKFISGSRAGTNPVLWLARIFQFNWEEELQTSLDNVAYLCTALSEIGISSASQTVNVLIPKPSAETCEKWQLMCVGQEAQLLAMPHVGRHYLEDFVEDLKQDLAAGKMAPPSERFAQLEAMDKLHIY